MSVQSADRKHFSSKVPSIAEEFAAAKLGDRRRSERLTKIAEDCSRAPDKSFPELAGSRGRLESYYRFWGSPEVTPEKILAPHVEQTLRRAALARLFLLVHDTTEHAFPGAPRDGLGTLRGSTHGFLCHTALAVASDGSRQPLGVLGFIPWVREEARLEDDGPNEYARWKDLVDHTNRVVGDRAETIHIMDREGDSYALLSGMLAQDDRFVVRLAQDRLVITGNGKEHLKKVLSRCEDIVVVDAPISRRRQQLPGSAKTFPPRDARIAKLAFGAMRLRIKRPRSPKNAGKPATGLPEFIDVNVVCVRERETPEGADPVDWFLVTTEAIDTKEAIQKIVEYYRTRWVIEEFHKVLKTGCSFLKRQVESYLALLNVLTIFIPIAWRVLLLRTIAQQTPDLPAKEAFTRIEIDVLRVRSSVSLGASPTVKQAFLAVAALGGHLKNNGPPGWLVLARGMETLRDSAETWAAAERVIKARNRRREKM